MKIVAKSCETGFSETGNPPKPAFRQADVSRLGRNSRYELAQTNSLPLDNPTIRRSDCVARFLNGVPEQVFSSGKNQAVTIVEPVLESRGLNIGTCRKEFLVVYDYCEIGML